MIMNGDNEGRGGDLAVGGPKSLASGLQARRQKWGQGGEAECTAWSFRWRRGSVLVASVGEPFFFIELG